MPIRVLLVEDSQIATVILKRILESFPQIELVGTASTGVEALALMPGAQPDVICTDLHMPQMDGLEFTKEVMFRYPCPILVISASVQEEDTHQVFDLLEAGAVDIFPKPLSGLVVNDSEFNQALINKIQILSGVRVFKKRQLGRTSSSNLDSRNLAEFKASTYSRPKIVVVGASTGGPQALQELFAMLPPDFPVPVICVQHICFGFLQGFIEWLTNSCQLPIQIAQAGEIPKAGHIYFPPEQQHLELDHRGRFVCTDSPPVDGHRPSVTATFQSVVQVYGRKTLGVLLTGMGRDGAAGMKTIMEAGGVTIAQDEATSIVFGMPKEAIKLGAASQVLPIQAIAPALLYLFATQPVSPVR
ncbi:chemotaxis-specific protein-glutamate methyltransferase CheB [Nodosilinea sp. LEGE 07088]|uniref:chemotaxis-specific protein-glutamate methyltransferase CheB n=1 Tax=Nodosilinea sp. LEGE 07088 TaxID=2777968 RepID=UPI00187E8693|nr:chemotaxis-specific protein-glutamate methyltransferase CheB [Nodosilinea sp. LEGE 07088]MBE9141383.1 chemotaxis-specific protein-glutamate methyltransferase CheB [Nodosilinea sp. LEGE 07088]